MLRVCQAVNDGRREVGVCDERLPDERVICDEWDKEIKRLKNAAKWVGID